MNGKFGVILIEASTRKHEINTKEEISFVFWDEKLPSRPLLY